MSSSVRLSVVCRLSVTFVHATQAIDIFRNVLRHLVRMTSIDFEVKFYGDRPRGTPPSGGGVKPKRNSQIQRFWTVPRLYLGNGARQEVSYY